MTASSSSKSNLAGPNGWEKPTAATWRRGCYVGKSKAISTPRISIKSISVMTSIAFATHPLWFDLAGAPITFRLSRSLLKLQHVQTRLTPNAKVEILNVPCPSRGSSLQPRTSKKTWILETQRSHPLHQAYSPFVSMPSSLIVNSKIWSSEKPNGR